MTPPYGIDTSVLMRLLSEQPEDLYLYCRSQLLTLAEQGAEVVASNQVIGEAYVALQHSYGVDKNAARIALYRTLRSGLVSPQNGASILEALQIADGAGLVDRLIAEDYARDGLETLTLDQRMTALSGTRRI